MLVVRPEVQALEELLVADADQSSSEASAVSDADVAALIEAAAAGLQSPGGCDDAVEGDRLRLTRAAFRFAADHPEWTLTPVIAGKVFEKLVRVPRILAAYRDGVPIDQIGTKFGIARSSLYTLLADSGVSTERPGPGRRRQVSHAAVRLDANDGLATAVIASRHDCSVRTVQRILSGPVRSEIQAYIDRLDTVEDGEPLRGAWNRYLDALAVYGPEVAGLPEPLWPTRRDRRALAAAAIAYRYHYHQLDEPDWLERPNLISTETTSPVPEFIDIALPLTPAVVARYNVALDEDSFHSV